MAGLVPAIHVFLYVQNVDARDKPGHDVERAALTAIFMVQDYWKISLNRRLIRPVSFSM